ncbi:hypothetical protein L195_g054398 [Trifolium pratense]|uniref:Uncharacterized protein n=1 Tax=Trifolium pratense TaxID=57577 RepID=A0A2K3KFT3_TRIPR|nr:hypothetical protein L195_g054398 [Trifolium pratense]
MQHHKPGKLIGKPGKLIGARQPCRPQAQTDKPGKPCRPQMQPIKQHSHTF